LPFVTNFTPKALPALQIDSIFYDQLLMRSVALQASHYFFNDTDDTGNISAPIYTMKPSNSYRLDDYTRFTTMQEVFIEFIARARFIRRDGKRELSVYVQKGNNAYYGSNALVLLDGTPVSNHELIYNYNPLLVEYINIYPTLYIFGGYIFEGIVELKTYRGQMQDFDFEKSTQVFAYNGLQLAEKMIVPDYSLEINRKNRMPDSRHTLFWNPDIQTNGKSTMQIHFNTSDLTGEFQATIEGLTKGGQFIYTTTFFKVE
jgi:hypothetical protein